jgi:hypothetical protein
MKNKSEKWTRFSSTDTISHSWSLELIHMKRNNRQTLEKNPHKSNEGILHSSNIDKFNFIESENPICEEVF